MYFIINSTDPFYFTHGLVYAVCRKMNQVCHNTSRNARLPYTKSFAIGMKKKKQDCKKTLYVFLEICKMTNTLPAIKLVSLASNMEH